MRELDVLLLCRRHVGVLLAGARDVSSMRRESEMVLEKFISADLKDCTVGEHPSSKRNFCNAEKSPTDKYTP